MTFDRKIASEILSLIDDHKHLIQDQKYIDMCNYLQSQYKHKNNRIALTDAIHNFDVNERVVFDRLDGTVVKCEIVNVDRTTFPISYEIQVDNNDTIIKTTSARLFKFCSTTPDFDVITENIDAVIPEPSIKTPHKVFMDIKYRQFIKVHTKIKRDDVHSVLLSLGMDCENNATAIINKEHELINDGICDETELKILYINERNKRCKSSREYIFIKKEYERIIGYIPKLAF